LQAVTIAGGYTYRAKQDALILKRGGANAQGVLVPPSQPILPGDIIEVQERFF
jgi:polysaccharide export outer membrane protein